MKKLFKVALFIIMILNVVSCKDTLEPKPVDLLTAEIALNEAKDVPNVEIALYSAFRNIIPASVIAGDCTADMLIHRGTFTQYRELGNKNITTANGSAAYLWSSIYNAVYIANFLLERLPDVPGVKTATRDRVIAVSRFLRGYSYFIALYTFGGVPEVLSTSIEINSKIPRASEAEIRNLIIDDYNAALGVLTTEPTNAGYASDFAVRAALAKYFLYIKDWPQAESFSSQVISSNKYALEPSYASVVNKDFPTESIFEMGYSISDDPGTDSNIGLNNLFVGRREVIPSNQIILALSSNESGDRFASIKFDPENLKGTDNGWAVAKYGTKDEDNNNVMVMRLAEMYLIRAEARARQAKITGVNGAIADVNVLRTRANAPTITTANQSQMIQLIEDERRYELAFEGHRWYDLVRTGRASQVMPLFNSNWKNAYDKWPIPQREIQNNPALADSQNPGY
jgi:starch-binding outer membrane protein, SusD/RagB family